MQYNSKFRKTGNFTVVFSELPLQNLCVCVCVSLWYVCMSVHIHINTYVIYFSHFFLRDSVLQALFFSFKIVNAQLILLSAIKADWDLDFRRSRIHTWRGGQTLCTHTIQIDGASHCCWKVCVCMCVCQ